MDDLPTCLHIYIYLTFGWILSCACGALAIMGCGSKLLKEKGLLPELNLEVDNIVCALDHDLQGVAAEVATKLREKGQSVDLVLESKPLKWY